MDARWYSSDLARFTSPDYYNLQQLALPAGARHQLLPYLGKNYQDLLRDPAQQMRYGYVMGNGLTYLDWLGLCSEPNVFVKAIYSTSAAIDGAFDAASFGLYSDLANSAGITTGRNANSTAYQLGQSAVTGAEIGASLGVVPLAKAGVRNLGKQVSKGLTKQVDDLPARLPQDINVNPNPPRALDTNRPIGKSPTQNAEAQNIVRELQEEGYTDIRVNQQQVNAEGNRVGINRPDIQGTNPAGQREYWELDTTSSTRGPGHETRIRANDPEAGAINLITMD